MAETQFSSGEKEQVDEWTVETVEVRILCYKVDVLFFVFKMSLISNFLSLLITNIVSLLHY